MGYVPVEWHCGHRLFTACRCASACRHTGTPFMTLTRCERTVNEGSRVTKNADPKRNEAWHKLLKFQIDDKVLNLQRSWGQAKRPSKGKVINYAQFKSCCRGFDEFLVVRWSSVEFLHVYNHIQIYACLKSSPPNAHPSHKPINKSDINLPFHRLDLGHSTPIICKKKTTQKQRKLIQTV